MSQIRIRLACWLMLALATGTTYSLSSAIEEEFYIDLPNSGYCVFQGLPPAEKSVLLFINDTLGLNNFTFNIESSKPGISQYVPGSISINNCSENLNISSIKEGTNTSLHDWKCYNITFLVSPGLLGYSTLNFSLILADKELHLGKSVIACKHLPKAIDLVFSIAIRVLVVLTTFGMGNGMEWSIIKQNLKNPKAPIVALVSQYVIMPLLGYAIVYMMKFEGGMALGIFLLGIAPGGGNSNMFTKLLNGDMSVSITMTTISTVVSLGMLPLWLYTLGQTLPASDEIERVTIPFLDIFISLVTVTVPLGIGYLIKLKLERVTRVIQKCLKAVFLFVIAFVLTVGVYSSLHVLREFTAELVFASAILPYGGFILGGIFAWICRLDWTLIKTVSIETGIQNSGIPFMILLMALPSPDVDLALMPVIASSLMTSFPFYVIVPIYYAWQKCRNKTSKTQDIDPEKPKSSYSSDSKQLESPDTQTKPPESENTVPEKEKLNNYGPDVPV